MNNKTLPGPVKTQMIKYGQDGGKDYSHFASSHAEKQIRDALTSVECNLNHLADSLKDRFKALLISQLSLLRHRERNFDVSVKTFNIRGTSYGKYKIKESTSTKRNPKKIVHFEDFSSKLNGDLGRCKQSEAEEKHKMPNEIYLYGNADLRDFSSADSIKCSTEFNPERSICPILETDNNLETKMNLIRKSLSPLCDLKGNSGLIRESETDARQTEVRHKSGPRIKSSIPSVEKNLTCSTKNQNSSIHASLASNPGSTKNLKSSIRASSAPSPKSSVRCFTPTNTKKSPVRVSLSSQLKSRYAEGLDKIAKDAKSVGTTKRRNKPRTKSTSPKEVSQNPSKKCPTVLKQSNKSLMARSETEIFRREQSNEGENSPLVPENLTCNTKRPNDDENENDRLSLEKFWGISDVRWRQLWSPLFRDEGKVRKPVGQIGHKNAEMQLQMKLMLNAISTLLCVTHGAVQRITEEDFDPELWTAILKNVKNMESELERFGATFVSDDVLPSQMAVKEAEDRLKTRLDVLFNLNKGSDRFLASNATRQDIMNNIELLKLASYKYGAATQNEMIFNEMKLVVREVKELAEVFHVCGERFSKRLKGRSSKNYSQAMNKDNVLAFILRKCFLGSDEEEEEAEEEEYDDNNHCIKRSSSLDVLANMCCNVFDRLSDVQKALLILTIVGLIAYVVTQFLCGACGTISAIGDMWNNHYILPYGPSTV